MSPDALPPIAIVGMACKFPGGSSTPHKLWDMIAKKQSGRCEIPKSRMNVDAFYHPDPDRNGTFNIRAAHFLDEDISAFDASFFSISPAEASGMDPQQRMMMESAYEAIENAGIPMEALSGSNTSCYVGCFSRDYNEMLTHDPETSPVYVSTGNGAAILSNRISYMFNLKGPSLTVDTACSSSLVALHLACQSLRTGESKSALVGGTNLIFNPDVMIAMSNVHFLGPDAKCHTYDHRANGYSRGEGIAAIYLKPLADAIRDNDTIRAVIRSSVSNQDGRTAGIMLPSREAQEILIRAAYESAGCDPASVGYFEAHGTGTPAGDPIEAGAIGSTLGKYRQPGEENRLYVGSIKTNIGHLEGASGLASVIKTVLALEKGLIPPNLHFEKGNEAIDFEGWRIRVPTEVAPWPTNDVRRASINSFGFGGTNAHIILDDAYHYLAQRGLTASHCTSAKPLLPDGAHSPLYNDSPAISGYASADSENDYFPSPKQHRVFVWSTHEEGTAKDSAAAYVEELRGRKDADEQRFLSNLSYTLGERRSRLAMKFFIVANSLQDLTAKLESTRQKPIRSDAGRTPRSAFVFTGQGAQWWGMGRELLQTYSIFRESIASTEKVLQSLGCAWTLSEELQKNKTNSRVGEAEISQPLCTAIQMGLVDLLADWGVLPQMVIGHSSGEIAAAYAAGKLPFHSAVKVAYFRGLISSRVQQKGSMMACGLSEEAAVEHISQLDASLGKINVACINSPSNVTISGDIAALDALEQKLKAENVFARRLKVSTAYHSHHMLEVADQYLETLSDLELPESGSNTGRACEMISTVTCTSTAGVDLNAKYWVDNMLSPVRFSEGLQVLCSAKPAGLSRAKRRGNNTGVNILLEIGPHSALAGPVKQILAASDLQKNGNIPYYSALVRDKNACETTLEAVAALWARGVPAQLQKVNEPKQSSPMPQVLVDLPPYPWNHTKKFWAESRLSSQYRFRPSPRNDFIGAPVADWNPAEPRWRNFIRVSEQPWVKDHQVQGSIVYPAAGYVSMALEAAKQMMPTADRERVVGYTISEMLISRALVVPQTELGIEVMFHVRPFNSSSRSSSDLWKEFRVFTHTASGVNEHCRGLLAINYEQATGEVDAGREARESLALHKQEFDSAKDFCQTAAAPEKVYEDLSKAGLDYGSTFRNITQLNYGPGKALGELAIPDTKSCMPSEYEYEHLVHPATMDTFLQTLFPALTHAAANVKEPYMPTFIQELYVSSNISSLPGHAFQALSQAAFVGFREASAKITVRDRGDESTPVVRIQGVTCTALTSSNSSDDISDAEEIKKLCFDVEWQPDLDFMSKEQLEADLTATGVEDTPSEYIATLEMVASYFYQLALQAVTDDQVIQPHHQKFYRYMKHHREKVLAGTIEHQTPEWLQFDTPAMQEKMDTLIKKIESTDYEGQLLCLMGRNLPRILRNEVEPLALMLEDELLYNYYANSLGIATSYAHLQRYITIMSHKSPQLQYLEIGAGTGGATVPILKALGGGNGTYPRFSSYTYTDISAGFFEKAEQKFSDWAGLINYRKLNVEQDPHSQGFAEDEKFDVIIAFNVLHATTNMNTTIANVRKMLKTGGKLLLLEITHVLNRVFLPFGNLPGWWMSEESFRQWGPTMDEQTWVSILKNNGFGDLKSSTPDHQNPRDQTGRLMIAEAVDPEQDTNTVALPPIIIATGDVVEKEQNFVGSLQEKLEEMGIPVTAKPFSQLEGDDLTDKMCICVAELTQPLLKDLNPRDFETLKSILQKGQSLLWLTEGASQESSRPEVALMHGLARTLRAEHEGSHLTTFDFAADSPLSADERVEMLLSILKKTSADTSGDQEFSEKNGLVYIKRCIEAADLNARIAGQSKTSSSAKEIEPFNQPGRPLTLKIATPGLLDTLRFVDDPVALAPLPADYVKIDVRAVGLNFRDIMVCMGQLVDDFLGCECSGVVAEVGSAVSHLKVGDRVCTWTLGAYCNAVNNPAALVQPIPDDMDFSVAASLPIVYCTAYYGLVEQARIKKSETVLIHAAAGGVGQAAIMLCKFYGAEIFVTVGTKDKKEHIMNTYGIPEDHIFSSRNLTFVNGVRRMTGGKGVDIVLNCLSGDALKASWSVIAPFGRFIEIGKKDIEDNTRLGMAPFIRNVTLASVDLTVIFRQRKALGAHLLSDVMTLLRNGDIGKVSPITEFSFSKIEEAFRYMQAGKHMGKIVLVPQLDDVVPVAPRENTGYRLDSESTYVIAGGFGGLGRSLARRMASQGAKNLIILSRSGATNEDAQKLVVELQDAGVQIEAMACDLTHGDDLQAKMEETLKRLPPIRGVIQGAMVLEDRIFANMSHEVFTKVIRPKVHGSWNLHQSTLDQPLDFFIMLASAAGMVGDTSQGNYAAANAFQDALAHYRAARNLPATVIDLGMIKSVGYVAENEGAAERNLARWGFLQIEEEEFLEMMNIAMERTKDRCQIVTGVGTQAHFDQSQGDVPHWFRDPVFSHLHNMRARTVDRNASSGPSLAQQVKEALSVEDAGAVILDALMKKLSKSLMIALEDIDSASPTSVYGVDSLVAVEVRNWLLREVKADVPVFEILQASSLQLLGYKIAEKSSLVSQNALAEEE